MLDFDPGSEQTSAMKVPGRERFAWETTVAEERAHNAHIAGRTRAGFIAMREARDATLDMPRLIPPSIRVNMRAGHLPPPETNGTTYLKIPIDIL